MMQDRGTSRGPSEGRLIGRDALLLELVERVGAGDHLALCGPAGVGKTRLAAEIVARQRQRGRDVERLLAGAGTSTYRLGLVASAYGSPPGVVPGDIGALFDHYLSRWRSKHRRAGPTLLWLDDAPLVDDLSAALLRQAAADDLVQLVVTVRSGTVLPADLTILVSEGILRAIDVPPLDQADTLALARSYSAGGVSADEGRAVFDVSQGYPLFVRELVRGGLRPGGHRPQLSQLVEYRLGHLADDDRRLAEMIAAAEPVDHRIFEGDEACLLRLIRSGLVVWHDEHRLRLEHPFYSEYLTAHVGALRSTVYAELVDRAADKPVDPVVLAQWMQQGGRKLDAGLAETAARIALGSADTVVARSLVGDAGPVAPLLAAECLILEGHFDDGLQALEQVISSEAPVGVRVEAASSASRHLGLSGGDQVAAHRVLDWLDPHELSLEHRKMLLVGRLWLWLFGPRTDDADVELLDELIDQPAGQSAGRCGDRSAPSWLTYELLVAGTGVLYLWAGPGAAERLLRHTLEIESEIRPAEFPRARLRAIEGSWHIHDGRVKQGLEIFDRTLADPDMVSPMSIRLIAGNLALFTALNGQVDRALEVALLARPGDGAHDVFRFGEIARLTHTGNSHLARRGAGAVDWPQMPLSHGGLRTLELMLATRVRALADPGTSIVDDVATLAESGALGWLVVLYVDVADDRSAGIHRVVRDALEPIPKRELWSVVHTAAAARVEGDHEALVEAAEDLLSMGFVSGASRAFADVARVAPGDSSLGRRSIRGQARALRRWHGPWPEWVDGLDVPSQRQLAVAGRLVDGLSIAQIAAELGVSRRTVENHVYRSARALGVSGQDELVRCLST